MGYKFYMNIFSRLEPHVDMCFEDFLDRFRAWIVTFGALQEGREQGQEQTQRQQALPIVVEEAQYLLNSLGRLQGIRMNLTDLRVQIHIRKMEERFVY